MTFMNIVGDIEMKCRYQMKPKCRTQYENAFYLPYFVKLLVGREKSTAGLNNAKTQTLHVHKNQQTDSLIL